MTRLLSPHNYIIYIIYPKKFYFSIHISSLSLSQIIHENIYIYKKIFLLIHIYLFIYNINIHKNLFLPKKFRNLQSISYIYIIIIIIKISRITIKSLSLANYPENNILWIKNNKCQLFFRGFQQIQQNQQNQQNQPHKIYHLKIKSKHY